MALHDHPRLVACAVGAPALAVAVAFASHTAPGAGTAPLVRAVTTVCADPDYTRAELMNVLDAYRRSAAIGRATLRGIDQGHYWSTYECDDDGADPR